MPKSKGCRLEKSLGGNTFEKLWRQEFGLSSQVWLSKMLDPNFRRGRTFFEGPLLKYFFNPKASPLDIVWSGKVTLLLSLGHSVNQPLVLPNNLFVAHLSMRSARNIMGIGATPEWHPGLVGHSWEGQNDPYVGERPRRWERLTHGD